MAPVNPGYSDSVKKVKESILFKLANVVHLTIPDTMSRIEDLWNGIINDDFVFSFRNSLELKAYNSMERKWQSLSWELEKCVLEFVRSEAKGSLINCEKEEELTNTITVIIYQLQKQVNEKTEYLSNELKLFIQKSTLKDVMVQWTQTKMNGLNCRAKQLINKAKIDIENVKEDIRIMRMKTREKTNHEFVINDLARRLAIEMKGTPPDDSVLKHKFDTVWKSWMNQFYSERLRNVTSIKDQIYVLLWDKFESDAAFLNDEQQPLPTQFYERLERLEGSIRPQCIDRQRYISIDKTLFGVGWRKESPERCIEQSIDIINTIFRKIDLKLIEISSLDMPVDVTDASDILNDIESSIYQHNDSYRADGVYRFKFLPPYRATVVNHVARFLAVFFTKLDDSYNQKHSPEAQLEEYKSTAWSLFHNLVQSKTNEVIATRFFRQAIIKQVIDHVSELLVIDVEESILVLYSNSKFSLMNEIMTHLVTKQCFEDFKSYILDPITFAKQWIMQLMTKTIFDDKIGDSSKYAQLANTRIQKIFRQLFITLSETAIPIATEKSSNNISSWIDKFVSNVAAAKMLPLSCEHFTHVKNTQIDELSDFKNILLGEQDEIQSEVLGYFKRTTALTIKWQEHPVSMIMNRLWGCTEICMFCKEPCKYTDTDHLKDGFSHQCIQHRPQGIGGWRQISNQKPVVEFCNFLIQSDRSYEVPNMTEIYRLYKSYKTDFPNWDILPSADVSKYWMWVMCKYHKELKDMYDTASPDIPHFWKNISSQQAVDSITTPADVA